MSTRQEIDVDAVNAKLDRSEPVEIIRWAVETFAPELATSSSFGGESAVLLHLVTRIWPEAPILFVNTGFLFEETEQFRDHLVERLGLNLKEFTPELSADRFEEKHGRMWKFDPDNCCAINKVEPMQRAIEGYRAWMSGVRRDQSASRANTPIVRELGNGMFKISPIANWTQDMVLAYMKIHDLPFHPLYDKGFRSLGCTHCTRPVAVGEDARSGRWSGQGKTECGLHTMIGEPPKKDE